MLDTPVLAYDITNLTDARYYAAWGVDYLGFELSDGQPTQVADALLHAIREWVEGPKILGNFQLEATETIINRAKELELDGVLVSPFLTLDQLGELSGLTVLQRGSLTDITDLQSWVDERRSLVSGFVLESSIPWSNLPDRIQATVEELSDEVYLFLGASLALNTLQNLKAEHPKLGLALRGSEEEKVGYKSYEELDDIFDLLLSGY